MVFLFVCLCKLIYELGGARNVKFAAQVNNNKSTREFEDLSEIFTPHRDRCQIVLTNEIRLFYHTIKINSHRKHGTLSHLRVST